MPRTVFATFVTEEDAEQALAVVTSNVTLRDSAVLTDGLAGSLTLDNLDLTPQERSACEGQLKRGGFLMLAQAETNDAADAVLKVLHNLTTDSGPPIIAEASPRPTEPPIPETPAEPSVPAAAGETVEERIPVVEEKRIPIVEEELRIGKREVVRGTARVHSFGRDVPVQQEVELLEERADVTLRPVNRRLSEEEVLEGGLLKERMVEITEMREEAVVTKEAFVREELVVTKITERRVEQVNETVRRTEVETERLQPEDVEERTAEVDRRN